MPSEGSPNSCNKTGKRISLITFGCPTAAFRASRSAQPLGHAKSFEERSAA